MRENRLQYLGHVLMKEGKRKRCGDGGLIELYMLGAGVIERYMKWVGISM